MTTAAALKTIHVLMIVTSHDQMGATQEKTGFWLEELAAPYLEFRGQGVQVDLASPLGGAAPVDPRSAAEASPAVKAFNADKDALDKLAHTLRLADITKPYDAYFVVGGHGVMWDLAENAALQKLLSGAFESGKVVAAVCHGPAALVNVRLKDGAPLVSGRRVAGFSNEEEVAAKLDKVVPFALETRLKERGGKYENGPAFKPFAVRDGRLITGQNPASSALVARQTLEAVRTP